MEIYRSKAKEFARLAAAAKSARDGRRDRKLADMYWALSLGEEPAAPRLSKRSSEPATPSAIPTRRLVQTAGVEFVSSARRSMSEQGTEYFHFSLHKALKSKKGHFEGPSRTQSPIPRDPIVSPLAIREIPRILYAPGTGTTSCHHALVVGDEAAIGADTIGAVVLGAPWTVDLSGRGRRKGAQ
jgi:hypothetical protein